MQADAFYNAKPQPCVSFSLLFMFWMWRENTSEFGSSDEIPPDQSESMTFRVKRLAQPQPKLDLVVSEPFGGILQITGLLENLSMGWLDLKIILVLIS